MQTQTRTVEDLRSQTPTSMSLAVGEPWARRGPEPLTADGLLQLVRETPESSPLHRREDPELGTWPRHRAPVGRGQT